jgi:hypothetical protein
MAWSCFYRRSHFAWRGSLRVIAPVAQWRAASCDSTAIDRPALLGTVHPR